MLTDKQKLELVRVLEAQPEVVAAYLFGSQSRKTVNAESDVDVAVLFSGKNGFDQALALEQKLANSTGLKVDVRALEEGQSPVFLMQAVRGELLVGHDEPGRVEFELLVDWLHEDAQQYFRIARHYLRS